MYDPSDSTGEAERRSSSALRESSKTDSNAGLAAQTFRSNKYRAKRLGIPQNIAAMPRRRTGPAFRDFMGLPNLRSERRRAMKHKTSCENYFDSLSETIARLPFDEIEMVSEMLIEAYENSRMIYLFGNGGSAALASHLACDLGKGTVNGSGRRFRVLSLTDNVPLMTAWANDAHYEDIFAEQLENYVRPLDIAFAISGSGNSRNVLNALETARRFGAVTIGLGGFQGGQMKELCDLCLVVPCENMQMIEDLHLCIAHALFTCIRKRLHERMSGAQCA
jgi:D-sedoheptulose 7-phosphate isomerase